MADIDDVYDRLKKMTSILEKIHTELEETRKESAEHNDQVQSYLADLTKDQREARIKAANKPERSGKAVFGG